MFRFFSETKQEVQDPEAANPQETQQKVATTEEKESNVNRIDLESVHTYANMFIVFLIIMAGTTLYSFREKIEWLPPVIILSHCLLFLVLVFMNQGKANASRIMRPNAVVAGWVWLFWLVYGTIFKDVQPVFSEETGYIQSAIAIGLVFVTYWKGFRTRPRQIHLIALAVGILLFFPHPDAVSASMSRTVLFVKVIIFYVVYNLTEMCVIMESEYMYVTGATKNNTLRQGTPYATEKMIIQSAWILMVSKYLIVGVAFQIIPIASMLWFYGKRLKKTTNEDQYKNLSDSRKKSRVEAKTVLENIRLPNHTNSKPIRVILEDDIVLPIQGRSTKTKKEHQPPLQIAWPSPVQHHPQQQNTIPLKPSPPSLSPKDTESDVFKIDLSALDEVDLFSTKSTTKTKTTTTGTPRKSIKKTANPPKV